MVIGYTQIKLGSTYLYLNTINKKQVAGSIKQRLSGKIIKHNIPARSVRDWEISGRGIVYDTATAATTQRLAIEGMRDDMEPRLYTDGMTTATVLVEDAQFDDTGENPLHFTYTIKMIEYNQVNN